LAPYWEEAIHSLKGSPHVIDIRNIGLAGAVELKPRDDAPGTRAYDAFLGCFEEEVMVRQSGDTLALAPPLIVSEAQIDQLVETLRTILNRIA
jgi:beta-alanine--pyruvate transaminase